MQRDPAKLTTAEFVAGLLIKILLGCLYGYIFLHYYNGDDTWRFHVNSITETSLLLNDPGAFFTNDITPAHALKEGEGIKEVISLYLIDLQYAILVKNLALLNLITGGNYYLNTAFFNLVVFAGHYWLFRTFTHVFPGQRKLFYVTCFLYIPAVFWLSGIRIDGLLFLFLSMFARYLVFGHSGLLRCAMLIIAYCGMVICRPETAMLVVPAVIAYIMSRSNSRPVFSYVIVYTIFITLFFSSIWWMNDGGLPGEVAERQHRFLALEGTRVELGRLEADFFTYVKVLPQALSNTFLRPFVWEARGFLQIAAAGEIILFMGFFLYTVTHHIGDWKKRLMHPVILFYLFLSISIYISVGYLVPFPGAIIRYKAAALIFLISALATVCQIPSYKK